jgi:hypothetical protein
MNEQATSACSKVDMYVRLVRCLEVSSDEWIRKCYSDTGDGERKKTTIVITFTDLASR